MQGPPSEPEFETLDLLGEGSSGSGMRARLSAPFAGLPAGAEVAVKRLAPSLASDPRALEALRAEAQAGRLVRDSSLVRVLHHGTDEEGPYLLLSYVPGRSLEEILESDGYLPEPLVRSVARQLAGALAALHAAGLVHGDVKPENIRLDAKGCAVLLDLGFALHFDAGGTAHAGTLAYLSPERARGGPPTPEADIWALGVTLVELATGSHPLAQARQGPDRSDGLLGHSSGRLLVRSQALPEADRLLAALATARPTPPSALVPRLSPFFDAIVLACLERSPVERIDAPTLASALREGEGGEWWRAQVAAVQAEGGAPRRSGNVEEIPTVGRSRELARLHSIWTVASGTGADGAARAAVVWLCGVQGSGKWRLISEITRRARVSPVPPIYLPARWRPSSEARPGGAALEWLARWLELPAGVEPGPRELERLLQFTPPDVARTLFGALEPRGSDQLDGSVPVALATWITSLSREHPLLLALDEVQRAGAVTLEALSILLGEIGRSRLMLVLSVREDVPAAEPELFARLRAQLERRATETQGRAFLFERIELGPVDEAAIGELVGRLFQRATPRRRLARALWRASHGNPGFAAEVLRELVRRGEAVPGTGEDPGLMLLVPPDDLPTPRSLDRLLAERLSVLAPEDRDWLERLAVLGSRIDPDLLVRAGLATSHAEIDPVLARLVRLGWLVASGSRYRFERPALREAAYRGISPGRRARLHLELARALERDASESIEDAYTRAYHLRMAQEDEELLRHVLGLLKRIEERASAQRRYTLATWGLDALDSLPATDQHARARVTLLEFATDAADRLGRREAQRRLLDRLIDLDLDPARSPGLAVRVYLLNGRYAASTGQLGLARGLFRNARELARSAGDPALESESTRRLAHVQGQVGELTEARRLAEQARESAVASHQVALAELELALFDILDDRIEAALAAIARALTALRGTPHAHRGIHARANLLRCRAWRAVGRPDRAYAAIRRALRIARSAGERQLESEAHARLGVSLVDLDRVEEAEHELRDALLSADEIEDRRGQVLAHVFLALLLWEEDDHSARAGLERAIQMATDVGFYRAEAVGRAILARVERAHGNLQSADDQSAEAFELLKTHGAELGDRIAIAGTRALVLHTRGESRQARIIVRSLRRRLRNANREIKDPRLRRSQRVHSTDLLEAVLSPDGPVFPRVPRY